jgi:hypothetical protein
MNRPCRMLATLQCVVLLLVVCSKTAQAVEPDSQTSEGGEGE